MRRWLKSDALIQFIRLVLCSIITAHLYNILMKRTIGQTSFLVILTTWSASGHVITFDKLNAPLPGNQIPQPYEGLFFSGSLYNGIVTTVPNGVVSAPNVLLSDPQGEVISPFNSELGGVF